MPNKKALPPSLLCSPRLAVYMTFLSKGKIFYESPSSCACRMHATFAWLGFRALGAYICVPSIKGRSLREANHDQANISGTRRLM